MSNDEIILAQLIGHLDEAIAICDIVLSRCDGIVDEAADPTESTD